MRRFAGVILARSDGAVLMQHRDKGKKIVYADHWSIPDGMIEEGEAPEEAASRGFYEETGYKVSDLKFLVSERYFLEFGEKVRRHIYWTAYDEIQEINCYEGQAMEFRHPSEFKSLKIYPGYMRFFNQVSEKVSHNKL